MAFTSTNWDPYEHPRYPENGEFAPQGSGEVIIGRKAVRLKHKQNVLHALGVTESAGLGDVLEAPGFGQLSRQEKFIALGNRHEEFARNIAASGKARSTEARPPVMGLATRISSSEKPPLRNLQLSSMPQPSAATTAKNSDTPRYSDKELTHAEQFVREHFQLADRIEKLNNERKSKEADLAYQRVQESWLGRAPFRR